MPCPVRGNDLGHFSVHLSDMKFFCFRFDFQETLVTRPHSDTSEEHWGLTATSLACFSESRFYPNRSIWALSFMCGEEGGPASLLLLLKLWKESRAWSCASQFGSVLFFSPLGCAQYSVWVWEDLSAFFLCIEAMRNEAMDLSYTTAWKNRPWPNK